MNGTDVSNLQDLNVESLEFDEGITATTYTKEEAVKKFGEKAKDGAIILEGKVTNFNLKASTKSSNEKELIKFLKSAKDYNKIEIFNRWGNLSYSLKSEEKIDEQKLNLLDDGMYYYVLEKKSGDKENGYVYKGEKSATTKQSEREQRLKEREELLNQKGAERKEIERQARENSNLSDEEIKERTQNIRQRIEERQRISEEMRKEKERREIERDERREQINNRLSGQIKERQQALEERKKELEERRSEKITEYKTERYLIISKNSSDSDIEKIKSKMQENGIQMKVSNLKRNKNGEITKIKISLIESSETNHNKKQSKSEATFERKNEAIPNIFVGKQNDNLVISSEIR